MLSLNCAKENQGAMSGLTRIKHHLTKFNISEKLQNTWESELFRLRLVITVWIFLVFSILLFQSIYLIESTPILIFTTLISLIFAFTVIFLNICSVTSWNLFYFLTLLVLDNPDFCNFIFSKFSILGSSQFLNCHFHMK